MLLTVYFNKNAIQYLFGEQTLFSLIIPGQTGTNFYAHTVKKIYIYCNNNNIFKGTNKSASWPPNLLP